MIKIQNISKSFSNKSVLTNISIEINDQEFVTILGPSGCGKSTLLNLVAGHENIDSGSIGFVTKPQIATVFQDYGLFPWRTAQENVALALRNKGLTKAEQASRCSNALKTVGLSEHADKYPNALSGGMKQRVALAQVLALDPNIILLDEPFGALDFDRRELLQDLLLDIWQQKQKTMLFVTHNIREAIYLGNRVLILDCAGTLIYDKKTPIVRDRLAPEVLEIEAEVRNLMRSSSDRNT